MVPKIQWPTITPFINACCCFHNEWIIVIFPRSLCTNYQHKVIWHYASSNSENSICSELLKELIILAISLAWFVKLYIHNINDRNFELLNCIWSKLNIPIRLLSFIEALKDISIVELMGLALVTFGRKYAEATVWSL